MTRLHLVPTPDSPAAARLAVVPDPPEKPLGLPLAVSELWDEIVPALAGAGLVTAADGLTVELALRHFVIARTASNSLIEDGLTVKDAHHGGVKKNPAGQLFRDNSAAFLDYAKQLGLSFAARARITMPDTTIETNPFSYTNLNA
jgi:P27 family predicted phage terminase small subunit